MDLPKFDELVSQREVAALHKRASREFKDEEGDSEGETWKMYDVEAMEEQNQDHNDGKGIYRPFVCPSVLLELW